MSFLGRSSLSWIIIVCIIFASLGLLLEVAGQGLPFLNQITPSYIWSPRWGSYSFLNGTEIIVVAGASSSFGGYPSNDVWLNVDGGYSWIQAPSLGFVLAFGGSAMVGNTAVIVAGNINGAPSSDVYWSSDVNSGVWTRSTSSSFPAREWHQAVSVFRDGASSNMVLVTFGGIGGIDGDTLMNDVWAVNAPDLFSSEAWIEATSNPHWTPRVSFSATTFDSQSRIVLTGGWDNVLLYNDVWMGMFTSPDPNNFSMNWVSLTLTASFAPRQMLALVNINEYFYVLAGQDNNNNAYNDVWVSADGGSTWLVVSAAANYPPRCAPAAAVGVSRKLLLLGGNNFASATNPRYNDVWQDFVV